MRDFTENCIQYIRTNVQIGGTRDKDRLDFRTAGKKGRFPCFCQTLRNLLQRLIPFCPWQEPAAAEDGYLTPEIQDELSQLSEPERRVITLSVFGGYTSREIAGILKKREGSIRSIKSRALAKLREKNADL